MDATTAKMIQGMDRGDLVPNGFTIKQGQLNLLRHLAKKEGRSASEIVRQGIRDYVFQNYLSAMNGRQDEKE